MSKAAMRRRTFLKTSAAATLPLAFELGAPISVDATEGPRRTLKIVCVGAHPDDPESGCGGALIRYAGLGHSVTVIYLTRGERGIRDTGLDEAAKIRSAEAGQACKIMGTKPLFFGQIDGDTRITRDEVNKMSNLLAAERPDVVFTHWPIDTHMDHQVASMLTIRACMALKDAPLYFFEVDAGSQTRGFNANTYVDISESVEKKKSALFAHKSQDGQGIWREHHEIMAAWRGREAGVKAAEAFVRLNYGPGLGPVGL